MQVPDEMRKGVGFLYCLIKGEWKPAGTAFAAGYPVPGYVDRVLRVFVTAQHVIGGIRLKADDDKVLMRLNTKSGSAVWAESSVEDWEQGDPTTDCAVLAWSPPPEADTDLDFWHMGPDAATDRVIEEQGVGIGDEVFMVGLFRNHLGRDRNEPIVRVGNIAAMPLDPIKSQYFGEMPAILIEARSIGGLSGSPVFVHMGFARWRDGQVKGPTSPRPFLFLGLMHGHWEVLEAEVDDVSTDLAEDKINTGIGVVVPAEQVLRSMSVVLAEMAEEAGRRLTESNQPVMDESLPGEPTDFGRFEDLTRRLVNVPKAELDEQRNREGEG